MAREMNVEHSIEDLEIQQNDYIEKLILKLEKNNLSEQFFADLALYKKEKYRRNFIKAFAIANDLNEKSISDWAFFGGFAVLFHLANKISLKEAIKYRGCSDIDIIVNNSKLSPTWLKTAYDIPVGTLYPCKKFFDYDIDFNKIVKFNFYSIEIPTISLDDLINLKKQAIAESVRKEKHLRDLRLLNEYLNLNLGL
ncbi:MAG: hypothetical protein QW199_01880 [Candidatus Pacearchaeota archaeon]